MRAQLNALLVLFCFAFWQEGCRRIGLFFAGQHGVVGIVSSV